MKLTLGFDELRIQEDAFLAKATEVLEAQVELAVSAALKEMISRVPVYTGTSRGALRVIGTITGDAIPISPVANRVGQGPSFGEAQSSASVVETSQLRVRFAFSTDVKQFIISEFYPEKNANSKNAGPWGALAAARRTFKEYMRANLKKHLPKLELFVLRTRVKSA